MQLTTTVILYSKSYSGNQVVDSLTAGKHLTIETSPAGEEILDAVVPEGKVWEAYVSVAIRERNA